VAFVTSFARADENPVCLFRGVVVPLPASEEAVSFARRQDDAFGVRLRVSEIIDGKCSMVPGKDYIFGLHSLALTFGGDSLEDVEGKEFIWLLYTRTLKDGTEVAWLERGEAVYGSHKESQINRKQHRGISNAKQLVLGCMMYSNDHNNDFPGQLSDIAPAYITAEEFKKLSIDPLSQGDVTFLYLGGGTKVFADVTLIVSRGRTADGRNIE
jgi:hypothetical protein